MPFIWCLWLKSCPVTTSGCAAALQVMCPARLVTVVLCKTGSTDFFGCQLPSAACFACYKPSYMTAAHWEGGGDMMSAADLM